MFWSLRGNPRVCCTLHEQSVQVIYIPASVLQCMNLTSCCNAVCFTG